MRRFWFPCALAACLAASAGCGPREPICSAPIDRSGRGLPLCDSFDEAVVCDAPGATARYERDVAGRLVLIDGEVAMCDAMNLPACADPMTIPRCLTQPPPP